MTNHPADTAHETISGRELEKAGSVAPQHSRLPLIQAIEQLTNPNLQHMRLDVFGAEIAVLIEAATKGAQK